MIIIAVIYLIFFLLGFNLDWITNSYDGSRILQISLALMIGLIGLFSLKENKMLKYDCIYLIITLILSFAQAMYLKNIFFTYDLLMWLSLFILFTGLKNNNFNYKNTEKLLSLLVFASVIPCFFILLSFYHLLEGGKFYDWQMNSGSIRIYDSVIVPIFWLAVYLYSKNKYLNKFYPFICFFIALALFVDGARSALLSLFIPLILLFLLNQNYKKLVIKTFLYFGLALIIYQCIFYFYNQIHQQNASLSIARYSSSYRSDIWLYMYEQWKLNPFWGAGGGYLAQVEYPYGHHMHNVYLRLIFEWGAVGILLLLWCANKTYHLMKSKTDIVLKLGVIAILIDGLFSGNFIYPASQVACILFLAIAFSQYEMQFIERSKSDTVNIKPLMIFVYALFVILVFIFLRTDMQCIGCASTEGRAAPFFWEHGTSTQLTKGQ